MPFENVSLGISRQRRLRSSCSSAVWSGPVLFANRISGYKIYGLESKGAEDTVRMQRMIWMHILCMLEGTVLLDVARIIFYGKLFSQVLQVYSSFHPPQAMVWSFFSEEWTIQIIQTYIWVTALSWSLNIPIIINSLMLSHYFCICVTNLSDLRWMMNSSLA